MTLHDCEVVVVVVAVVIYWETSTGVTRTPSSGILSPKFHNRFHLGHPSWSCSFHLHTQHQVAVAANHSNSFSHKHALPVTGNPFSIALPFSGTLSHKTFKHTPTAPHSGKPLNSTGQHTDTQPNKTFPYHSLLPSLNYLTIYTTYTPIAFLCNINFCMSSRLQHLSLHIYSNM